MAEEEQVNDFDLSTFVPEGAIPVGYVASVKFLRADGGMALRDLQYGVPLHEAVGISVALSDAIRGSMAALTHTVDEED